MNRLNFQELFANLLMVLLWPLHQLNCSTYTLIVTNNLNVSNLLTLEVILSELFVLPVKVSEKSNFMLQYIPLKIHFLIQDNFYGYWSNIIQVTCISFINIHLLKWFMFIKDGLNTTFFIITFWITSKIWIGSNISN